MNNKSNKVALLVHSCDRYELLYKGFETFFTKHWDFNISCNLYFATEEKKVSLNEFENILSGKAEWSDRLSFLLKQIPEDFVLYLQEDMWLNKDVNATFFQQLFEMAISNDWKQVKLHSSEVYKTIPSSLFIEGFQISTIDKVSSDFLMSHQVTLWNKHFLLAQLPTGEHPWRNERKGSKRLKKVTEDIFYADYFAENGKPEINQNNNPVKRSEYRTVSLNGAFNDQVMPFIEVLKNGNMDEKQYAEKILHHYQNQITHDGKPKPRKEDVFKKLKRWLKKK
jgi:hypothetical protein